MVTHGQLKENLYWSNWWSLSQVWLYIQNYLNDYLLHEILIFWCIFQIFFRECDNWFGNRFPRVVRYLQSLTHEKMLILGAVIIVIIGVIIFLGVFPASFVYVEYHEVCQLSKNCWNLFLCLNLKCIVFVHVCLLLNLNKNTFLTWVFKHSC